MSKADPSAPRSRLSKTNPADRENRKHGPSPAESLKQPLTERDDVSLRAEVIDEDREGLQPETWRESVWTWRDWYEDSSESKAVFENPEGEQAKGSDPNRYHPDYGDKQYAKLNDLERGIREDFGKRLHTALLGLTASSTDEDGRPLPPVDHLDAIREALKPTLRELRRLRERYRRVEWIVILEPHPKSGYLHAHIAVFVDGVVRREDFEPVVGTYVENCDLAGWDAHDLDDPDTLSVRWAGGERDRGDESHLDQLAIYLAEYLGTYGGDPLEADREVQMANAVLWATGAQRWRPSNGAQEYMRTERSESSGEWELIGIEDGSGELHELDGGGGGVRKLETWIPDRPPAD